MKPGYDINIVNPDDNIERSYCVFNYYPGVRTLISNSKRKHFKEHLYISICTSRTIYEGKIIGIEFSDKDGGFNENKLSRRYIEIKVSEHFLDILKIEFADKHIRSQIISGSIKILNEGFKDV